MTDSRNARTQVQVLFLPVPDARLAREQVQTLSRVVPPEARDARLQVQVLTLKSRTVRTVGSSRPLLMKDPDGTWKPVNSIA